jgi:hypothetical protein
MAKRLSKAETAEIREGARRMAPLLARIQEAIATGKATLDTFAGTVVVIGYSDESGWARCVTPEQYKRGDCWATRSFLVCADQIKLA